MSHEKALSALKLLMRQDIVSIDPSDHVQHMVGESDRSTIILHAATLESFLVKKLEEKMPALNSDERSRLFGFEGPLGSFSNRIRFAHALGIIDRPAKRRFEMIKELRNVAAHCHARLTFGTPQVRDAVASLFGKLGRDFDGWDDVEVRGTYSVAVTSLNHVTTNDDLSMNWDNLWANACDVHRARVVRGSSR